MTTDTKAVARWKPYGSEIDLDSNGEFVLFTDHERIVEEIGLLWARELVKRDDALAAIRAEVEGLKKDAERYRWLRNPDTDVGLVIDKVTGEIPYDEGTRTGGYHTYEYRAGEELDTAIDAAMEKGNV